MERSSFSMETAIEQDDQDTLHWFAIFYEELKRIAAARLSREQPDAICQPTALVNDTFVEMSGQAFPKNMSRSRFFACVSAAMRRVLIGYARRRTALKRGGRHRPMSLSEFNSIGFEANEYLLALDESLHRLAALDPRQARIVELRFFLGFTIVDTAKIMEISHATVERDWKVAKAWLHRDITRGDS